MGLMCAAGRYPTWHVVMLIPVMMLQFLFLAGLGMFLAATTVFVRDIMQALTTIILLIVFFTPIFYPLEKLPVVMQKVTFLNPFHHMVDAYRHIMWHQTVPDWRGQAYLGALGAVFFVLGLMYFDLEPLPADTWLLIHLALVAALMFVFPFSKLLHAPGVFFSPTRNQADNPREQRHVAPWAVRLERAAPGEASE